MLKKAIKFLRDSLLEDFGQPATLINLLRADVSLNRHLVEHQKGISASEVVRWNDFGDLGYETSRMYRRRLNGWTRSPGSYQNYGSTSLVREDLLSLGTVREIQRWNCDIQQVDGFSASKSELRRFKSMDAMVERNSQPMITPVTQEKLEENLRWDEIRIISREDHDYFSTWEWDGRVFLINSGGSHHFAAAKYIAKRIGVSVPLTGRYKVYGINQVALASLRRDFDIFVLSWHCKQQMDFHRAMQRFEATYYWKDLPRPYTDQAAIFLPKEEKRAGKVSDVLREAGFQDLGLYLQKLANATGNHVSVV